MLETKTSLDWLNFDGPWERQRLDAGRIRWVCSSGSGFPCSDRPRHLASHRRRRQCEGRRPRITFMSNQSHDPIIKLEEAVDQNGRARYEAVCSGMVNEDATIAPWIDVPVRSHSDVLFSGADLYFLFSIS